MKKEIVVCNSLLDKFKEKFPNIPIRNEIRGLLTTTKVFVAEMFVSEYKEWERYLSLQDKITKESFYNFIDRKS